MQPGYISFQSARIFPLSGRRGVGKCLYSELEHPDLVPYEVDGLDNLPGFLLPHLFRIEESNPDRKGFSVLLLDDLYRAACPDIGRDRRDTWPHHVCTFCNEWDSARVHHDLPFRKWVFKEPAERGKDDALRLHQQRPPPDEEERDFSTGLHDLDPLGGKEIGRVPYLGTQPVLRFSASDLRRVCRFLGVILVICQLLLNNRCLIQK